MHLPGKYGPRDASFFQYKLLQITALLILSLVIYFICGFFDLGKFEKKDKITDKPVNKEELRLQNIFRKNLSPNSPRT